MRVAMVLCAGAATLFMALAADAAHGKEADDLVAYLQT